MSALDPVTVEVIRNALIAGAEEMNLSIWRTARSTVVRETLDYSTALFDGQGRAVAQSTRIPIHLNSMSVCLDDIVAGHIALEDWNEGDIILTNDPYCGGQHLPDFVAFQPIFANGQRVAIAASIVHHVDVGGGAPGSYYANAREVYQEGLRLPPVKLRDAGMLNDAVVRIIRQNSREPDKIGGDVQAQIACLQVGATAIERMVNRYGGDVLMAAMDAILDQSEAAMRAAIRALPGRILCLRGFRRRRRGRRRSDSRSRSRSQLRAMPVASTFRARPTRRRARSTAHSTWRAPGSTARCCVLRTARRWLTPVRTGRSKSSAGPDRSSTAGSRHRLPTGWRPGIAWSQRCSARSRKRRPRRSLPPTTAYRMWQRYRRRIRWSKASAVSMPCLEVEVGGWGAHPEADGASGFSAGFHNLANSPIEMCETLFPITFTHYGLIPDSGGRGQFRGRSGPGARMAARRGLGRFVGELRAVPVCAIRAQPAGWPVRTGGLR